MEPKSKAWHRRNLKSGQVYYTTEGRFARRTIVPGPGDRPPTPRELADAWKAQPGFEIEAGLILYDEDSSQSEEDAIELPAGCYSFEQKDYPTPNRLEPLELRGDSYLRMPGVYEQIAKDVRQFLKCETDYQELGFQYRRGILLYGPPGNGKTSLLRELIRAEIPPDAVIIFMNSVPPRDFLRTLQESLKSRLKVVLFEELAAAMNSANLDSFLNFQDGEYSLDRSLVIATTNYPAKLPGNIVDRPSRFDKFYKIAEPTDDARKVMLEQFIGRQVSASELEATRGLSAAAVREVCLLVRVYKMSVESASRALQKHKTLVKKEFGDLAQVGFRVGIYDDE